MGTFFVAFPAAVSGLQRGLLTQMIIFEANVPDARFRQSPWLRARRIPYAEHGPKASRAIGVFSKAGGTLPVGAGVATVAARSGN